MRRIPPVVLWSVLALGAGRAAAQEALILKKTERWGPCPTNHVCEQTTELYATGRLIKTGRVNSKEQVGPMAVERVLGAIRRSGVLTKPCAADEMADPWITYAFAVDGVVREVRYPGCEKELKQIDDALEPPPVAREVAEPMDPAEERDDYVEPGDDDPLFR